MLALALLACADEPTPGTTPTTPTPTATSGPYADPANWLCHPDHHPNACDVDLTVTEVGADGTETAVPFEPAADPAFDCFYVYPTNSLDDATHSDRIPGVEEPWVVGLQAARYGAVCRVFAPIYRQITVQGLFGELPPDAFDLPYGDVEEAFRHAIANGVEDRPFLLLGHSQGSVHLTRLLAEVIEPDPALHARLVAAHLIGGFVEVPIGEDVGGSFASTPLCRAPDQAGCVVHYNAFRDDDPPTAGAFFGIAATPGTEIACALPWGDGPLDAVFPSSSPREVAALIGPEVPPFADGSPVDTPWFALPGLLRGGCARGGGRAWLAVTVDADPDDPRADDIGGDLLPGWGLHLVDVNLAQRDLIAHAAAAAANLP